MSNPDFLTAGAGSQNYDINTIIKKVNAETNRRYTGSSGNPGPLPQKSRGQVADDATIDSIINRINQLNTIHCYCQNHLMQSRNPGSQVAVNSVKSDFEEDLDYLDDTPRNTLLSDIQRLQNQCACNTYTSNYCACDNHYCSCQVHCSCETNEEICSSHCYCNKHCTCDIDEQECRSHKRCNCHANYGCTSNYDYTWCNCDSYSAGGCQCHDVNCSCDSHVCYCQTNSECPCEVVYCGCESVECSCDGQNSSTCGCEGHNDCTCNPNVYCDCDNFSGTCFYVDLCPSNCGCHSHSDSCNGHCTCDYDCNCHDECGCDTYCSCNSHCTCYNQCGCEFN